MAKQKSLSANGTVAPALFKHTRSRRRSGLFLRRFLTEEAEKYFYRGKKRDEAFEILKHWANLESQGHLAKKETALDAGFLEKVFGDALGYRSHPESPEDYQLERNFSVPGVGTADAALGNFAPGAAPSPLVVIELKGAGVDLDRDRFNGRTAVQQCWDYLNALPDCPWGIVSNFVTFRLYHKSKGSQAYEEFALQELRNEKRFWEFYCVFERGGLVRPAPGRPLRANELLERTENRQREVGDELYDDYSSQRVRLIEHLHYKLGHDLETSIYIAQRILDRIIFVAFCEDRDLLREKTIDETYRTVPPFAKVTNPRWHNFFESVPCHGPGASGTCPTWKPASTAACSRKSRWSTTSNSTTIGPTFSSGWAITTSATK